MDFHIVIFKFKLLAMKLNILFLENLNCILLVEIESCIIDFNEVYDGIIHSVVDIGGEPWILRDSLLGLRLWLWLRFFLFFSNNRAPKIFHIAEHAI
jgi:hypothetical protein